MSHEKIADVSCPLCGAAMSEGYIAGHWVRLRWCDDAKTLTIFSGTPLMKQRDLWHAPTLEALRCEQCKVGVFSYDN